MHDFYLIYLSPVEERYTNRIHFAKLKFTKFDHIYIFIPIILTHNLYRTLFFSKIIRKNELSHKIIILPNVNRKLIESGNISHSWSILTIAIVCNPTVKVPAVSRFIITKNDHAPDNRSVHS